MEDDYPYPYNQKTMTREVYCYSCKVYSVDDRPDPRCKQCGKPLYVVTYSLIDGKRLTGEEDANPTTHLGPTSADSKREQSRVNANKH